jgi:hypothetical protein
MSVTIICVAAWMTPSFARATGEEERGAAPSDKAMEKNNATAAQRETDQLIQRMLRDGIIDETKGFVVEKKHGNLFINGQLQAADLTARYLNSTKQEQIRVQVYPFKDRVRMHPDASLLQLALPATLSSPCINNSSAPKKDGC